MITNKWFCKYSFDLIYIVISFINIVIPNNDYLI